MCFLVKRMSENLEGETESPLDERYLNALLAESSRLERALAMLRELEKIAMSSANWIISQSSPI